MNDEAVNIEETAVELDTAETQEAPKEAPQDAPQGAPQEPAEAPAEEKVEFTPEQQEVFNKAIARKVAQQRDAERKAEEAQRLAEEAQQRLEEAQKTDRPSVPPMPDPYDDDYEAKIAARDQAILETAKWDQQQDMAAQQAQYRAMEARRQQEQQVVQAAESYRERAGKLGVDSERLRHAGQVVANFGVKEALVEHILTDERGPEITCYLADNLTELEKINEMSPLRAAAYIESQVKAKARPTPPTKSPPVTETEQGGGFKPDGGLPGVTYE